MLGGNSLKMCVGVGSEKSLSLVRFQFLWKKFTKISWNWLIWFHENFWPRLFKIQIFFFKYSNYRNQWTYPGRIGIKWKIFGSLQEGTKHLFFMQSVTFLRVSTTRYRIYFLEFFHTPQKYIDRTTIQKLYFPNVFSW